MDVTAADVARIPPANLRVPVEVFAALWVTAERSHDGNVTCRWLANAVVRPEMGPAYLADSPVTERTVLAIEELIEAEYVAAVKLAARRPRPAWLSDQPGWIEAVEATLAWAWHGLGEPPMAIGRSATG